VSLCIFFSGLWPVGVVSLNVGALRTSWCLAIFGTEAFLCGEIGVSGRAPGTSAVLTLGPGLFWISVRLSVVWEISALPGSDADSQ
jgi:hypothetical protein